jgi:hypothetical protein
MRKYVIEREVPGIGNNNAVGLRDIARQSNAALAKLAPRVVWQQTYVVGDKTFCIYMAEDEAVILEHSKLSGFPADIITEVKAVIDPATAG